MREWQSQSHVRWYCRYHVVWVPKYRKRAIFGEMRRGVVRIVRELCQRHGVELVEGHALSDHVHVLLGIPPKLSVANTVGFLKGKSAIPHSSRVSRRLMREHDLQAPQRAGHAHGPKAHDGTITTETPDVMWGTDMTATVTVAEGAAVVFVAVDHWRDRVHRAPCRQAREPLRGPGADPPGHPGTLRGHRRRRSPRATYPARPRVELLGRRFPTGGRGSSASKALRASCGSPKATVSRSASFAR